MQVIKSLYKFDSFEGNLELSNEKIDFLVGYIRKHLK